MLQQIGMLGLLLCFTLNVSAQNEFITTWRTTTASELITVPTTGTGYHYDIDWGDGTIETGLTGSASHTYTSAGTYTVKISGDFPRIYFNNSGSRTRIQTIEQWGNIAWTSMAKAFKGCNKLISNATDAPDLTNVTSLEGMFENTHVFEGNLSNWNVSTITNMAFMFEDARAFNGNISTWDVSNVEDFSVMFKGAETFNQNISAWNTSKGRYLDNMFNGAAAFDQNVSSWNVASAENMESMFEGATAFDQDLGNWEVSNVMVMENMLDNTGLSLQNYDNTLIGWSALTLQTGVTLGASGLSYCNGSTARQALINNFSWTILGDINDCPKPFITTWQITAAGESITIPTQGAGYSYEVDWGDGTVDTGFTGDATHTYATAGTYTVEISGDFPNIYFNNSGDKNKIVSVEQWGDISWSSMQRAFEGCTNLVVNATDAPDLSAVTSLARMFKSCSAFNQDINHWDVGNITNMSNTFEDATAFNQPLQSWNVSSVRNMRYLFSGATKFNQPLNAWDVSKVQTIEYGFANASDFNQDLNNWNTASFTSMYNLFYHASDFDGNISTWDVSNIVNMASVFSGASAFNQNIGSWNTSNVITMEDMFRDASSFNQNIGSWDVGNVFNLDELFNGALAFNQDISSWNVEKVTSCMQTFANADAFNQDLSNWNVSAVQDMANMFLGADAFDQDLGGWNISSVTTMSGMFGATSLSALNYDNTLIGWSALSLQNNVVLGASGRHYCSASAERQSLITNFGWTINDAGQSCTAGAFITTWETTTTNETITIPTNISYTYAYTVNWGDGTVENGFTGDATHTYATAGTYTVEILGDFPAISFNNGGDKAKILTIEQWGITAWRSMSQAFYGCANLTSNATDQPDLSNVTDIGAMFQGASSFNSPINHWDVSNIQTMSSMFHDATNFHQDLDQWNTSNLRAMEWMFANATNFNGNIATWDVSKVKDFSYVFHQASSFNGDLSNWNVSSGNNMESMFRNADVFNSDVTAWNVANVTTMRSMFRGADRFNQNLGNWDVQNVSLMSHMLNSTALSIANYDSTLMGWSAQTLQNGVVLRANNSNYCASWAERQALITNFGWTIYDAGLDCSTTAFITTWETTSASESLTIPTNSFFTNYNYVVDWGDGTVETGLTTDATHTYASAGTYTVEISGDFPAIYFNNGGDRAKIRSIEQWGTTAWQSFDSAFYGCSNMTDQATDAPDLSLVTNMRAAFRECNAFDGNLSNWDMTNVADLTNMLDNCGLSTENYDKLLIAWSMQSVRNNLNLGASGLAYCVSEIERQKLIDDFGWTITDAGFSGCPTTKWDGSTWDNGTPHTGVVALIESYYDTYIDGALAVGDLIVSAGNTLTIRGDSTATVDGNLLNYGAIVIQDTSALVQTLVAPSNSGSGTYTVEKESSTFQEIFNYWSSPIQNTTITQTFAATGQSFYEFDAVNQAWQTADKNAVLSAGQGFAATGVAATSGGLITRSFSGNAGFHSGTITVSPEFDGTPGDPNTNWNLVGNPYPSGLDAVQFLTDNSGVIENAVYLWSSDGTDYLSSQSDYATMNAAGTVNAGGSGVAPSSATISSCQGFFVQTLASGDITFQNSQRISTNNTFMRTAQTGARAWVSVTLDDQISNEILLGFFEDGAWEKDRYDAAKLSGNAHLSFYSQSACTGEKPFAPTPCPFEMDNKKWAIQGFPPLDAAEATIPLGLEANTAGKYSFSINHLANFPAATELYLYDAETERLINLHEQSYTLELAEGTYENRFYLRTIPTQVTNLGQELDDIGITAYAYQYQIHIQFDDQAAAKSSIGIFDISGKLIQKRAHEHQLDVVIPVVQTGVYIIRIENKQGVWSKKLLMNEYRN
ncbi:MAG: BspA family leucine-rich repeat surface protein [Flammeovirgaceae bacterium]